MIALRDFVIPDADAEQQYGVRCGDCDAPMVLRTRRDARPFWSCSRWPQCDGTHGAHPSGAPLGVPADRATRRARIEAHRVFDGWWRGRGMTRNDAYRWLAGWLGTRHAHISRLSAAQCRELAERVAMAEAMRELVEAGA